MTKRTIKTIIAMLMLTTICLYFISGTYARYSSSASGEAEVSVAKWAIKVGDTDITTADTFTLTLTPATSNYVASGKIAPSVAATGTIKIDPANAEVAIDYWFEVEEVKILDADGNEITNPGIALSNPVVTVGTETYTSSNKGLIALNGSAVDATVSVTWDNAEDANNENDTTVGIMEGAKIQVTLTAYAEQHIEE